MTVQPSTRTAELSTGRGVSIWLDDLSRPAITSGLLREMIESYTLTGVTTNPSIFAKALADGVGYESQLRALAAEGADTERAVRELTTRDVREACDLFAEIYRSTHGVDGRVSLEVDPRLAKDTQATIDQALQLADAVGRENLMIKIPATTEGLPAITEVLAAGISVNVTLIFSLVRYREVINAWLLGLEAAHRAGRDLSTIHSVASFFVSRVDTEIDAQLQQTSLEPARIAELQGRAGLANARLAYRIFTNAQDTERWRYLRDAGARVQRPLWASTGTKNPAYSDVCYVEGLIAEHTVNTMPLATLEAFADHGEVDQPEISTYFADDDQLLDDLAKVGIDYQQVVTTLEDEGIAKFETAWLELWATVTDQLDRAKTA
ncbi:transaldolase [Auritidibacter ignavus]|uniref:transaldolase n=1 Tax=Auritidibacter ignavus TaxID=678932 RepID=UPI00109C4878|nr:transaldolase [Auritidibacter ignavus]